MGGLLSAASLSPLPPKQTSRRPLQTAIASASSSDLGMFISRPDPVDDQVEADEDQAASASLVAAQEEDPARTSFILSHPSLSVSSSCDFCCTQNSRRP